MHFLGEEFLRQFLLHVPPEGFMRIRHYGYLPTGCLRKSVNALRRLKPSRYNRLNPVILQLHKPVRQLSWHRGGCEVFLEIP